MVDYEVLLDSLTDGVYFVDLEKNITYWNRAAEKITGFLASEVTGLPCSADILTHVDGNGKNLCQQGCPLGQVLTDGVAREDDVYLHHKDGHRVPVTIRINAVRNGKGEIAGAVELFSERGARRELIERIRELEDLAMLDPLTGLANRRYFENSLGNRCQEMRRFGWSAGLLMMDLDHFKRINDTYGHEVGDRVLKSVSATLTLNTRSFDLIGRWGGEEFVGLIRNIDPQSLRRVAEKLRGLVESSYVKAGEQKVQFTFSAGVTMLKIDDTPSQVLERADCLLYQSKGEGRNRVSVDF